MSMMLDTRSVSIADRPDYWAAAINEHFFPVHVEPHSRAFDARLRGGDIGPLDIRSISGPAHRVTRTSPMVEASDPECVLLYLVRQGTCRVEQDGRGAELQPGDLAVHDTSRPSAFEGLTNFDVQIITFPKWFLGDDARLLGAHTATRVEAARPLVRGTLPLLAAMTQIAETSVPDVDGVVFAEMLLPFMRNLYSEREELRASGAMLEAKMRQYALRHLGEPTLGPDQIARAHYVSTRYVHKLFASSGGVSAWIREQRLEAAARELRETDHSVASVAMRWGYRDAASFARAFRRARGCSPRQQRSASYLMPRDAEVE